MARKNDDNDNSSVLASGLFILSLIMFALNFSATKNNEFLIKAGWTLLGLSILIVIFKSIIIGLINKKHSDYISKIDTDYRNIEEELEKIDMFTGVQFEQYISTLLKREGYSNIKLTKTSGDYGVDIIAEKDGLKCAIQCKRYHNNIPINAIQEIKSGKTYYKCDKAMVITNSYYTQNAKNLASSTGVQLFDRDDLIRIIKKHNNENFNKQDY